MEETVVLEQGVMAIGQPDSSLTLSRTVFPSLVFVDPLTAESFAPSQFSIGNEECGLGYCQVPNSD